MKLTRILRRAPRFANACWNGLRGGTIILGYHRITSLDTDPFRLAVTPESFDAHLAILKNTASVLSLQDLTRHALERSLPRRAIGLTFDDGYADNLRFALPLLRKHDLPATVFVTTGNLDTGEEFWWDELERIALLPGRLPETLRWRTNGAGREFHLGDDASYTQEQFEMHRAWDVSLGTNPTRRQLLFRELWRELHDLPPGPRKRVLEEIREQAGLDGRARPTHRIMSEEEIRSLAKDGLVEIGAHTVTHPSLATLSAADQRDEIVESRDRIGRILQRPVESFSYPYGSHEDLTPETVEAVRNAGFQRACVNVPGVLRHDFDLHRLPRFLASNWDPPTFKRKLWRWFHS